MKRVLLIVAVLIGMAFATATPAQAWYRRGGYGYGYYGRPAYGAYYRPYAYGPRAYNYYGGYPGYYYGPGVGIGVGVY
jgi:hypothetical protein